MIRTFVLFLAFVAIFSSSESRGVERKPKPKPFLHRRGLPIPKTLHADQCEVITRTDCLRRDVRRVRGKRICAQIPEPELFKRLQDIGGWNPLYIAMNKTQAEKFSDPRWFFDEKPPPKNLPSRKANCTSPRKEREKPVRKGRPARRSVKPKVPGVFHPDEQSTEQEHEMLNEMGLQQLKKKDQDHPQQASADQDEQTSNQKDTPYEETTNQEDPQAEQMLIISKRAGSRTQGCWKKGDVVESSNKQRYRLCGECHVVTTLEDDVRPRIINEATCKHALQDSDPNKEFSGNGCVHHSGLCEQRVIHFPALRLAGFEMNQQLSKKYGAPIFVEKWVEFTKEVKAGCQCQMYRSHVKVLKQLANAG